MIWKCANPECGKPFDHTQGRFFRFRQTPAEGERLNVHCVRHYWLCGACGERYSLREAVGDNDADSRPNNDLPVCLKQRMDLLPKFAEMQMADGHSIRD